MSELLLTAISPLCLPMTVLLAAVLAYWALASLGLLDLGEAAELVGVLRFKDTPLMVALSIMVLCSWFMIMAAYHFIARTPFDWLIYVPVLIISYFAARLVGQPVGKLFTTLGRTNGALEGVEAKLCTLLYDTNGEGLSQGRIKTGSSPILVNVKARPGKTLAQGSEVLIIEKDVSGKFYYVEEMNERE